MSTYVDTSAAAKLLVEEPHSAAFAAWTDDHPDVVGTLLLETELRRTAHRLGVDQGAVSELLRRFRLFEVTAGTFREAGALPGARLRSLDALHLAAALRLGCQAIATYDERMADAARELGFDVVAPGMSGGV